MRQPELPQPGSSGLEGALGEPNRPLEAGAEKQSLAEAVSRSSDCHSSRSRSRRVAQGACGNIRCQRVSGLRYRKRSTMEVGGIAWDLKKSARYSRGSPRSRLRPSAAGFSAPLPPAWPKQVTDALNLPSDASEEDVEMAVIKADPTQLAKLRQIDADLKRDMAELGYKEAQLDVERERIHQQDRASARERQVQTRTAPRPFWPTSWSAAPSA